MRCLTLAFTLLFVGSALSASADTFDFAYSNANINASGTLDASLEADGFWHISGITGERNGIAIIALDPLRSFSSNDNILTYPDPTSLFVNYGGTAYETADGMNYNFYSSDGVNRETITPIDNGQDITLSISDASTASPVPEPSTFLMLGTGLLSAAGVLRRRLQS